MYRFSRSFLLAAACAALISACGGSTSGETPGIQSKAFQRNDKTASLSATSYQNVVQQLYVAYYGRPADPAGLSYWEGVLLAADAPTTIAGLNTAYTSPGVKTVVDSFGNSAESQALYGSGNASGFINAIYENVLARSTATDQAGATYWSGLIASGTMTQAQAALAILAAAASEPVTSTDEQVVPNRLAAANQFTPAVVSGYATTYYSGTSANLFARAMLNSVGASSDPTTFPTMITNTISTLTGVYGLSTPVTADDVVFNGNNIFYSNNLASASSIPVTAVVANPAAFAGVPIYLKLASNSLATIDSAPVYLQNNSFSFNLQLLPNLAAGTTTAEFQISACQDPQCLKPFSGSPWLAPFEISITAPHIDYFVDETGTYGNAITVTANHSTGTFIDAAGNPLNASLSIPITLSSPVSATYTTLTTAPWITAGAAFVPVNAINGESLVEVTFSMPTNLLPGSYSANVVILASTGQQITVPVTLNLQ